MREIRSLNLGRYIVARSSALTNSRSSFRSNIYARVRVAAQLPPPINGLSVVNGAILSRIREKIEPEVNDLSARSGTSGISKYLSRIKALLQTASDLGRQGSDHGGVLYMPSDGGLGILGNIFLATRAAALGYRLYIHHHSFAYVNTWSRLMKLLIRYAPKRTCHIVLCQDMGDQLSALYARAWGASQARYFVLSNGFTLPSPSQPQFSRAPGPLTLGHMSNLTAAKGVITFLRLFQRLREAGVDVHAKVAGSTTEPEVERALSNAVAAYPGTFVWVGPVYGSEKAEFFRSLDLFVFPTTYRNEAQPLVLLEAIASAVPLVSTARGCIDCDFDDSVGLVVRDAASFLEEATEWIGVLSIDRERLSGLQKQAWHLAEVKRKEATRQLESLIDEMITAG